MMLRFFAAGHTTHLVLVDPFEIGVVMGQSSQCSVANNLFSQRNKAQNNLLTRDVYVSKNSGRSTGSLAANSCLALLQGQEESKVQRSA